MSNVDEACYVLIEERVDAKGGRVRIAHKGVRHVGEKFRHAEKDIEILPSKNTHLNKIKVSDVERDRNVTGVWECWQDNEEIRWDLSIAQAGDYFVRIGAGVSVTMGDLLESAGDGTARPQADDVIRSSTIGKVNATFVIETYPDGSYTVPCNLMCA